MDRYPNRRPAILLPLSAAILLLLLLAVIQGCGTSSPAPKNTVQSSAQAPEAPAGQPSRTYGILYPAAHSFYEMITRDAEAAAAPRGIRLLVKAPEEASPELQIQMLETMIKMKVDGIAVDPVDPAALSPVIDKAVQAGIPVITFESDAPGSKRLSFIGSDAGQSGLMTGQVVAKLLRGRGMILVENGYSKLPDHQRRLESLLGYIRSQTDIQVLEVRHNEGSSERAVSDMETMIEAHPHFDALITLDIVSGTESILVWKAKGLNRSAVSFGMLPASQNALQNGQLHSVISRNEQDWGKLLVEELQQVTEGKTVPVFRNTGLTEVTSERISTVQKP